MSGDHHDDIEPAPVMSGDTPEGWEPVDWIATNISESIDGLLIGHDVFGEAWDDAGLESRRVFLCEVAGFVRDELGGSDVARLRAEAERLTAALAEEQAETRGRVQEVVDWMAVVKLRREEFAATVERLTRERDEARLEVCVWHGRDIVGQRFPGLILGKRGARQAASARGWGYLYPEDTNGPVGVPYGPPKPGGIVEAFAALREACAGEYDGVDAAAFVDELRGKGPDDSTTDETERPDPADMHGAGDDFGGSDF